MVLPAGLCAAARVPPVRAASPALAGRLNQTRIWAFHNADDDRVPVNASRHMVSAVVTARGLEPHLRRSRTYAPVRTTAGMQMRVEAIESWLRRDAYRRGHGAGRFGELRYTEYLRGGHDAWTRAAKDARLAKWALG